MSNNLGWTTLNGTDDAKSSIINANKEIMDGALSEALVIPVDTGKVLTTEEYQQNFAFEFAAGNTILQSVTIPDGVTKMFAVINLSPTASMRVVKGTTEFFIGPESGDFYYTEIGTDALFTAGPLNSQASRYLALNIFASGQYTSDEIIASYVCTKDYTLSVGLPGSIFKAENAPTDAAASLTILKNGASIGSIDFAQNVADATFTFATETSFATGDVITIQAPTVVDAGLSDVHGVLEFTEVLPEDTGPGAPPLDFVTVGSIAFMRPGPHSYSTIGSVSFVTPGPHSYTTIGCVTFVKPS